VKTLRYEGYFIGIPDKSNSTVVTKFSYDILVERTVAIEKKKSLFISKILVLHFFTKYTKIFQSLHINSFIYLCMNNTPQNNLKLVTVYVTTFNLQN